MAYIQNSGNVLRRIVYQLAPYNKGNLRDNGITGLASSGDFEVFIKIGTQEAPYAVLLNDEAVIRGHNNKHYQWVNKSVDVAVDELAKLLGGIRVK